MGEQPVSSQSADAGVGQQAARRSAMSRCSRRQFRRLFGAYDRAKGHHMAIVPARGWRGSCDVPVGWTEEHQCTWNPESGAPRAELLRCHGVLTSALKRGLTAGTTGHSAGPARAIVWSERGCCSGQQFSEPEISSVDRCNKASLQRTLLRSLFKSSARDSSRGVRKLWSLTARAIRLRVASPARWTAFLPAWILT